MLHKRSMMKLFAHFFGATIYTNFQSLLMKRHHVMRLNLKVQLLHND